MKRLKRLGALVRKEMVQIMRDRSTLVLILALPLLELFLFAYAVDMVVDHIPTAVVDLSLDAQSHAFVDALAVSGYFDIEMYLASETQAIQAIDQGRVRAGVIIPPHLAAQIERGQGQVLMVLDGADSFTVQSGYSAATAIAQAQAIALMVEQANRRGLPLGQSPIYSAVSVLYNANLNDMIFIVPGLAAILLQYTVVNLTAMAIVRERELGTIEQLLITPARPIELMLGKMVPNVIVSSAGMLSVVLMGIYWFGVPFRGNPWLFAWLTLVFIVSGLGLGLLVSTVSQTQRQAQQITMLLMLVSLLLTGFIYPREPMPAAIKTVSNLIPLTYYMRIVRGIFTKGVGLAFVWNDVLALAIYGAIVMAAAAGTFKKRLD